MDASEITSEELEATLARLHQDSFGWALSCCGWNEADAADVLQSAYLKIVSGKARFGAKSAFRTWLFGVIRQTAREHHRRAASHLERARRLKQEISATGEGVQRPDDTLEQAETSQVLLEAMRELPPRQREVLHLVFYQNLTIREAAEVMAVSLGSARVHYDRAKKRLRGLLEHFHSDRGPSS
jgi:RNA polymerase sigma-70 factor (ECF subfamily)